MGHHGYLGHALLLCCLLVCLLLHCSQGKEDNSNNNKRNNNNNNSNNNNNNNNNNRINKAGRSGRQGSAGRCRRGRTWIFPAAALKSRPAVLRCGQGPVVSTAILAVRGRCRGSTGFTRWNAGRCMWNQTCELAFQNQAIDSLTSAGQDKSCLGQMPDKLEVNYTCLRRKVAVTDVLGQFQKTRRTRGIVRSHRLLPWSYRNGEQLGNVTFLRPRRPPGLAHLWISVYYHAILARDLVFLSWEQQTPPGEGGGPTVRAMRQILANDTTFPLHDVSEVILTFYADYHHHPSALGGEDKGFLLCYQWLKPNRTPKKGSVCSKVMMPAKCKGNRGKGRRRKGGNSGSRKKNRGSRNKQGSGSRQAARNRRPGSVGQRNRRRV